jgi:hypothetical protein
MGMKKGGMPMKDGKPAFMMKKGGSVKRYNGEDGSEVAGYDEKDARDEKTKVLNSQPREEAPPAEKTFKEAFAEARKDGDKTFEYKGKKYTTELAKPAAKPAASSRIAGITSEGKLDARTQLRPGVRNPHASSRMTGFAKGGGIESKGKTKGTVVKMASGGNVSSRADGIAQRGKTKTTIC